MESNCINIGKSGLVIIITWEMSDVASKSADCSEPTFGIWVPSLNCFIALPREFDFDLFLDQSQGRLDDSVLNFVKSLSELAGNNNNHRHLDKN